MRTNHGPMAEVFTLAKELEREDGVVDVSLLGGFPYADIPKAGVSIVCTTRGDANLAHRCATKAAHALWARRHEFDVRAATAEDAVRRALESPRRPIVLADVADNPASGGVGDHPALLRTALAGGVRNAAAALFYDPDTVGRAVAAGLGGVAEFRLGAKVASESLPLEVRAKVQHISDGRFVTRGPMNRGLKVNLGRTVVLATSRRITSCLTPRTVDVVVAERRHSTDDPEMLRMVGIEPTTRDLLILKSKGHFRAAFGPLVADVLDVDTGGVATLDLTRLRFRHVPRPIFPLDDTVRWSP